MAEILIKNKYSTQNDIENCIIAFYKMNNEDNHLEIIFSEEIQEIDILLIAYLILFKEIKPEIRINIKLNRNTQESNIIFKLYQYLVYSFLATGKSVFKIFLNNYPTGLYIDETSPPKYSHQYFVLSDNFMPIFLIGKQAESNIKDLFDLLFNEKIEGLAKYPEVVEKGNNSEKQYDNFNRWIKGYQDNEKNQWNPGIIDLENRIDSILYLARLAFYNVLNKAKIARFYFSTHEEQLELRISYIYSNKSKDNKYPHIEFFNKTRWIFDELSNLPPIYHFIYSQLLSTNLLPSRFNNENQENVLMLLHSLWDYTKEMVSGIKELSKNIREHANPPYGAITGRIYKEDKWIELKRSVERANLVFDNYLEKVKENNLGNELTFFDFNVIDLGQKGIIETLKDKTDDLLTGLIDSTPYSSLLKEDLECISKGIIGINHFLDTTVGNTLNQQSKKAIAHLGLLVFSNLVKSNGGLLRAGSINGKSYLSYPNDGYPVPFGTNFHIVLPISKNKNIRPFLPHPFIPLESAPIEIRGIEEMLDYEIVILNEEQQNYENKSQSKPIYLVQCFNYNNADKILEIRQWDKLNSIILQNDANIKQNEANGQNIKNIFCIDFERSNINESQLFRFLGLWNLNYPKFNLIVTNIETDIFHKLIKINEFFIEKLKKSSSDNAIYWNDQSPMLIYSYCIPKDNEKRFYFTDILWGREEDDFYYANKLISKTNFNSTTQFGQSNQKKVYVNYDGKKLSILAQSILFYSGNTLLPFDLLLPSSNNLTLFEHNASVLLQNELKIQENSNRNHD